MTRWFLPTYYVDKMRKEGMIQKIDKSKLSNFSNLDPDMLNKPFDPNNDYSIPYIWGATAIGVNGDAVDPKSVTSWAVCGSLSTKAACC